MRKLLVLAFAVSGLAVPFAAQASDVPDGADCATSGPTVTPLGTASEPDRGQLCVSDGNGTVVFYIGGEAQAEEEGNPAAGGSCGAIIVANNTVAGNPDWDNAGPDGVAGTADDQHCD